MPKTKFHRLPPGPAAPPHRANRLPALLGLTGDANRTLDDLAVAVVGTGSVGRRAAEHLARLQVKAVRLVDPGRYKPESPLTQPIGPEEVGQPKATATARACAGLSPRTRVYAFDGPLAALDETELADVDLFVAATDNLTAELSAGETARRLGRPLFLCSVHGETLTAQVRALGSAGDGPCPACAFGAGDWARLNGEVRFSCEGLAPGAPSGAAAAVVTGPTTSLSALCALAADLGVLQVVRHALGLGRPVLDTQLEFNAYRHATVVSPLRRKESCPCEHRAWGRGTLPRPLPACSPADLLRAADFGRENPRHVTLTVPGHAWVSQSACAGCGYHGRVDRFLAEGHAGPCPACSHPLTPHPLYRYEAVPLKLLHAHHDRPFGQLGAAGAAAGGAVLRSPDRGALLLPAHAGGEEPCT